MKTLLAVALLTGLALAQTPSMKPESDQLTEPPASPDQATVKPQTVRGCLSSAADNYTVTDQVSGKTFKLEGNTDRLKQYIGQTVEITGSVKSIDGDSKPATASTGDILTLSDVKQVSDKCSAVPNKGGLRQGSEALMAEMQRPVNDDANTQLDSSLQMSSYAADTSAAATRSRSVTTNTEEHSEISVGGHAGQHQISVDTADTSSVGQSTPPTDSAAGYAHQKNPNDKGPATIDKQSKLGGAGRRQTLPSPNPSGIGSMPGDGEKAAIAATQAEMHTDTKTNKTTYQTQRKSEANGSDNAKEAQQTSSDSKPKNPQKTPQ